MKKFYRAVVWVVTLAVPVVIACVYGMPYRYRRNGRVLDKVTKAGISKINVRCQDDAADGGFSQQYVTTGGGGFEIADDVVCPSIQFVDSLPPVDAGPADAGPIDAGAPDAGAAGDGGLATDAGIVVPDGGAVDAGSKPQERTARYQTRVLPYGEDAGWLEVGLDRSN